MPQIAMPSNITTTHKYKIPFFFALIAAGLAGNYFNFPIFLNIDFLFGSIFSILALQLFGINRGIFATIIIASYTYVLWNHPYAIITMTAEVAIVGWLMERRNLGMVLADTIYWLIIGMPLVFLFYHLIMNVSLSNVTFTMTKQAVNGIANALVAKLIFTGFVLWSRSFRLSFRDVAYNLLAFFVLFPALIMLAVGSRSDFNQIDSSIRTTLLQNSRSVNQLLETWVANRKVAIIDLAELAASKSTQEMQTSLELIKSSDRNFLRIGLLDKEATIIAYYPLRDELGQANIGKNFADRPFIPQLKRTLKPMLSEVVMGRIGVPKPMVTMLAPVVIRGEYNGYITGILGLEQIQKYLDKNSENNSTLYTLIDKNGNVIMSNRSDQTVMTPFVRDKGTLNHLDTNISQWIPVTPPNISITEHWKKSFYIAETTIGELAEWKLLLEQPVAPFQKLIYDNYAGKLTLLFLILIGALVLAELLSRQSIITLEKLRQISQDLPIKLATGGEEITWPESGIQETHYLVNNFREMAKSLTAQFNEVCRINETLEYRVEERTKELKASEERYRSILNASPDDITITDMEGRIVMVSPTGVAMFGYDQEEKGWGRLVTEFIAPEDRDRALSNFALKARGMMSGPDEYRGLRMDGSTFDIEVNSDFIRGADGQPTGMVYVVRNITERKQSEEEKKHLQAQLLQAQKMEAIGTLAGGIAHDFNNILGAILGYTEIVKDAIPPRSFADKNLDKVLEAGHRAATLVKQILAFSRQTVIERVPLDPAIIVREVIKLLRSSLPSTITIKQQIDTATKSIFADSTQVHQILMNLCTNAFHAMEQTGGTLEITLKDCKLSQRDLQQHPEIQSGNFVMLSISDTGLGIEPEIWGRIFDPYFTTKEVGKGTGMGLSIVHGIITSYGGFITSENNCGNGTVFRVYFPAIEQEIACDVNPVEATFAGTESILLVDDEEMLVDIGKTMLEQLGYKVTVRTSSLEALVAFQNQPNRFDVVITDQTMPGMTGMNLARQMVQIRPDIPIILCTGYSTLISEEQAKVEGVREFVMKPLTQKVLAGILRRVLDQKSSV